MDVPAVIQALGGLSGLATLVTALGVLFVGWRNGKKADAAKVAAEAAKTKAEAAVAASEAVLVRTEKGVFELGAAIDGRLTALLAAKDAEALANEKRARAEGVAEGEQAERKRQATARRERP